MAKNIPNNIYFRNEIQNIYLLVVSCVPNVVSVSRFSIYIFGEISGFDLFSPRISGYDPYKSEPVEDYILCLTTENMFE
jgi:hypothetical protein